MQTELKKPVKARNIFRAYAKEVARHPWLFGAVFLGSAGIQASGFRDDEDDDEGEDSSGELSGSIEEK